MGPRNSLTKKSDGKTFSKLYRRWLDEKTPPGKETLDDSYVNQEELSEDAFSDQHGFTDVHSLGERDLKAINLEDTSTVSLNIPMRYVWIAVGIFSTLLVTVSVTLTVLIVVS